MWDRQGVLRGECTCGDCQEFMAGTGVRCEYCDCVPSMHKKVDVGVDTADVDYSKNTYKSFPEHQGNEASPSQIHHRHKCSQCSKCFKDQFTRRKHEKRVHNISAQGGCRIDSAGFIVADTASAIKQEPIDELDETYENQMEEAEEISTVSSDIYCLICNRKFKALKSRNRHIRDVHGEPRFACTLCDQRFKQKGNLQKHIQEKHSDQSPLEEGEVEAASRDDEEGQVDMALVKYDLDMDAETEVDSNMSMTECDEEVNEDSETEGVSYLLKDGDTPPIYDDDNDHINNSERFSLIIPDIKPIFSSLNTISEIKRDFGPVNDCYGEEEGDGHNETSLENYTPKPKAKRKRSRPSKKTAPKIASTSDLETTDGVEKSEDTTSSQPDKKKKRKSTKPIKIILLKSKLQQPKPKNDPENVGRTKCNFCEKLFINEKLTKKHERNAHTTNEFPCQYCGKIYKRKYELVDHERSHTGQRPFKCEECDKAFFSKHNLRTHQMIHKFKGKFQCQFCGRDFDSKGGMVYHERSHTGERPYPCSECGKTFGHKSILACHMRIHTGEKPYPCRFCTKAFRDQSTLRKHERIHTLEKPYKCTMCDKAYNQRWCLREHVKYHLADGSIAPRKTRKNAATTAIPKQQQVSKSGYRFDEDVIEESHANTNSEFEKSTLGTGYENSITATSNAATAISSNDGIETANLSTTVASDENSHQHQRLPSTNLEDSLKDEDSNGLIHNKHQKAQATSSATDVSPDIKEDIPRIQQQQQQITSQHQHQNLNANSHHESLFTENQLLANHRLYDSYLNAGAFSHVPSFFPPPPQLTSIYNHHGHGSNASPTSSRLSGDSMSRGDGSKDYHSAMLHGGVVGGNVMPLIPPHEHREGQNSLGYSANNHIEL